MNLVPLLCTGDCLRRNGRRGRLLEKRIDLAIAEGVARLTLLQGDSGNVLDFDAISELEDALAEIRAHKGIRVVLLSSRGRNFCFGGSLTAMLEQTDLPDYAWRATQSYHRLLLDLVGLDVPIVSALRGASAGAGVALATLADYVIAAEDASFTIAFTGIAFTPDGGTTYFLPRLIGLRRFQELVFSNRRVLAAEAARIGLVTETVPVEAFADRVEEVVARFARAPTSALVATRRLLLASGTNDLAAQLELESQTLVTQCNSPDVAEGISAVLAKRQPNFTGA